MVFAALVAVGLIGYGDFGETLRQLANFPVTHLFAALALASLNYFLRFVRWSYYLYVLEIKLPLASSALVFLSGLAMSITPGKTGEVLKSYLLRDRTGVPVSTSLPAVVMERLTDLVAVILLGQAREKHQGVGRRWFDRLRRFWGDLTAAGQLSGDPFVCGPGFGVAELFP